jgi:protein kinase-like protein
LIETSVVTRQIGPWRLVRRLGKGGNADVWEAESADETTVALKVLRNKRPGSESYKRFRDEILLLRELGRVEGVLPILDSSLPPHPSEADPAWLAMPVATGIRERLGEKPRLATVVGALFRIANALVGLSDRGISHRDIKPENLYFYADDFVIGDFGLAEFPGKDDLTSDSRRLGPLWYLAPEMRAGPSTAAGGPADVYSLAKTLWVIGGGQRFPLQGEHRLDRPVLLLSTYSSDESATLLDPVIEKATRDDPAQRLTMVEFREELDRWLAPPVDRTGVSLPRSVTRIAAITEARRRSQETEAQIPITGRALLRGLATMLVNVEDSLRGAGLETHNIESNQVVLYFCGSGDDPGIAWKDGWVVMVSMPDGHPPYLWIGVAAEIFQDGRVNLIGGNVISEPEGWGVGDARDFPQTVLWMDSRTIRIVEGPEHAAAIEDLRRGLEENLSAAIDEYARRVSAE